MPDYIEREKALKLIESAETWGWSNNILYDEMKNLPAADVAPVVHGKWIEVTRSVYYGMDKQGNPIYRDRSVYYCSECNRKTVIKEKYCPDCGAKMDLEEDK